MTKKFEEFVTVNKKDLDKTHQARLTSKPPLIEDLSKPYTTLNKIPFLLRDYRSSAMTSFKEKFLEQLNIAQAEEKKACAKCGMHPIMVGDVYKNVTALIDRCRNFYELEALARFIFDDNEIPTYDGVKRRSEVLKNACDFDFKN
jgi:hypothetical protein